VLLKEIDLRVREDILVVDRAALVAKETQEIQQLF